MRKLFLLIIISVIYSFSTAQFLSDTTGRSFTKIFGFELGQTKFETIKSKFGIAKKKEIGDAGEYDKRIPLYLQNENIYITFISGEMGAQRKYVEGMILSLSKLSDLFTTDTSARLDAKDLGGIKLGMTKESFFKSIPPCAIIDKSKLKYDTYSFRDTQPDTLIEFDNKIPMTNQEIRKSGIHNLAYQTWDEIISMKPVFDKGRLSKISINKMTSN